MSYIESWAKLSEDGKYRYVLRRCWSLPPVPSTCAFVMLNPSTADGSLDDPTIRRCVGFAQRLGHAALVVVNLFAYRATDPAELRQTSDAVGPENDRFIAEVASIADRIIVAWGSHGSYLGRDAEVLALLRNRARCPIEALRVTKSGAPGHPLYLPNNSQPIAYGENVGTEEAGQLSIMSTM